jgi:hypothetical protein
MNTRLRYFLLVATGILAFSCEQEFKSFTNDPCLGADPSIICPPITPDPPCPRVSGTAILEHFVAIGNSIVAGYQAGALYNEGQDNSLAMILAAQFRCDPVLFDQPDISSVNGFNATFSNPGLGVIRGRLVLFDAGTGAGPLPTPAGTPGLPAPYNTADLPGPYTGDKGQLDNFGVPGIVLGQVLTPLTGGPSTGNPAFNPYYARFASNPGTSTILGDAIAAQGSFYLFWLGINDVLGYAITGASGALPMTEENDFAVQYNAALSTLLASTQEVVTGVVGNIPDVTRFPYFNTVTWNAIEFDPDDPVDAGTVNLLNGAFAGFNAALDGLVANGLLSAGDAAIRKVSYVLGENPVLINDEELEDLGPKFDILLGAGAITPEQRSALALYEQARPLNDQELVTFPAALVLGTLANPADPTSIFGVVVPISDEFTLTETEIAGITERIDAFNTIIASEVGNSNNRIALADINNAYSTFFTQGIDVQDGVVLTPGFAPPTGTFSEDGIHPNSRGNAYLANFFIDAINAKFGGSIPHADVGDYPATGLPLP